MFEDFVKVNDVSEFDPLSEREVRLVMASTVKFGAELVASIGVAYALLPKEKFDEFMVGVLDNAAAQVDMVFAYPNDAEFSDVAASEPANDNTLFGTDEFEEGYEAYVAGMAVAQNPFPEESDDALEWLDGYYAAKDDQRNEDNGGA